VQKPGRVRRQTTHNDHVASSRRGGPASHSMPACAATLLNWGCGRESSTITPHSHPVFSYHVRNTRVSGQRLFKWQSIWLLLLTLGFSIVILIGVLDTRLETVASA
jgi:hypothetical protein